MTSTASVLTEAFFYGVASLSKRQKITDYRRQKRVADSSFVSYLSSVIFFCIDLGIKNC